MAEVALSDACGRLADVVGVKPAGTGWPLDPGARLEGVAAGKGQSSVAVAFDFSK